MTWKPKSKYWYDYPLRKCHTVHVCTLCCLDIEVGQRYFDKGRGLRAHVICAGVADQQGAEK